MISKATVHNATVLMNRRMNTERRVTMFGPVCSSVAGMALHHLEGRHGVQEGSGSVSDEYATLSRVVIWSSLISPALDRARDERISGESNQLFWLIAALRAQLRLTANMLDGMVALVSARASKVGELYNEVRDRVSDAAVFIGAGYAWGGSVALGYVATILAIFTA